MNKTVDDLKKRVEGRASDARFTEITSNVLLSNDEMTDILENGSEAIERISELYRGKGVEDVKIRVQKLADYDEMTSHWAGPKL
jgi:hypothetical protein